MLSFNLGQLTLAAIALSLFSVMPADGQVINEDVKLVASDAVAGDLFGISIAIDDGVVAVGAHWNDDNGISSGSAYIFNAYSGEQLFKLLPSDGGTGDVFGYSIAIDNGVVAVGAFQDTDNGPNSGSAYLFDASTGEQLAKLIASDGAAGDYFGGSIDIHNDIIAVGASRDDFNGSDAGSAYVFTTPAFCFADLDGDWDLDFFDISAFLAFYQLGDLSVDFTGDGVLDFFDVSAFLNAFNAGCP